MSKSAFRRLLGTYILGIAVATTSAASLPAASPLAGTDLICHTDNAADCYPRLFQPTEVFQVVHDDQILPPGLHVRMDIWKSIKEARLNIPMEGEDNSRDPPVELAAVVVSPPDPEDSEQQPPAPRNRAAKKPPVYEAAGKIQPPREPDGSVGDSENFQRAIGILSGWRLDTDGSVTEAALSTLVDLCHDIYYGVETMRRSDVLGSLMSITTMKGTDQAIASRKRHLAASILANSIQNNPTALTETLKAWKELMRPLCAGKVCQELDLIDHIYNGLEMETDPLAMKAKIYALHGLLKDENLRDQFLTKKGMDLLLSIFLRSGNQWNATRLKIAQFVMDTFLDENMGAELDVWPTQRVADSGYCSKTEHTADEGCWEYHLERMANEGIEEGEWKLEFLRLLNSRRGAIRHRPAGDQQQVSYREL